MNSNLKASLNFAHENFQNFVDELSELLRIKTGEFKLQVHHELPSRTLHGESGS